MRGKMLKSTDGGEEWERGGSQRGERKRISSILSLKAKFLLICIHAKEIRKMCKMKQKQKQGFLECSGRKCISVCVYSPE